MVGGKGGVGKTTCAAALAIVSARTRRTLLVSTDPASSLGDALDTPITAVPRRVPRAGLLDAAHLDASAAFSAWLAPRRELLKTIALRGTYLDADDVGRLLRLSLPGIDEVIALVEIRRLAADTYAHVVVDTAPTGHTLRLLAAPDLLTRVASVLDLLQAHHREVVSAIRGAYEADTADALIAELDADGRDLAAMLRDEKTTRITWVTLPEPMALEETADAIRALQASGLFPAQLVVNRVTPPPPGRCSWCEARRRFEARATVPLARRFPDIEVLALPALDDEPRGVRALASAWSALRPWNPRGGPTASVARRLSASPGSGGPVRPTALVRESTRWLLVGGKGGVGKSTCASAIALAFARAHPSRRVLLLSSDPAHSLGDVFGAAFGDEARHVPHGPKNLFVREIDAAAGLAQFRDRYISSVDAAFERIARGSLDASGDLQAFRQLIDLAPPGVDEVIAIADVAEALAPERAEYDLVVSDTAPTGHALRLLQTPGVLGDWTRALMAILLKYHEIVGAGALASLLVQLSKRLRHLEAWLTDGARTSFVVVTRPAALPRAESVRLLKALRALHIAVHAVVVNAAGAGTCARCIRARAVQAREVTALGRDLPRGGRYAIIEAPAEVPPPHGLAALSSWGARWQSV